MTDREIFHKLLDRILDEDDTAANYTEFFPGIPGEIPAIQKTYRLEIREATWTVSKHEV